MAGDQGAAADRDPAAEYGYAGSLRLVQERLQRLRPSSVRPAKRTGYRPGQVLQLDWAELPTRPRIAGRERRVYALVATLPYSGAQTAFFSLDMTIESFLGGHVRAFEWQGGVPRECVYDNLRAVVARRERDDVVWNRRFLHLRGHYGFHATACTPATPREKGSVEAGVRHLKSGFWPARRFETLGELDEQCADWRDRICNRRRHATGRFVVEERLGEERQALRRLPPTRFDWSGGRAQDIRQGHGARNSSGIAASLMGRYRAPATRKAPETGPFCFRCRDRTVKLLPNFCPGIASGLCGVQVALRGDGIVAGASEFRNGGRAARGVACSAERSAGPAKPNPVRLGSYVSRA